MKCPKCNEELKEGSIICPNCGNKTKEIKEKKEEDTKWGLVLGCSAIISALVVLFIHSQIPIKQFLLIYLGAFVVVFLCLSIIYLIFRK